MKNFINKVSDLKLSKKFLFNLQLGLLGVVIFLAFNEGLVNEIKYLLEILNVKNVDKVISNGVLLYKALYDVSQIYTIFFLTIKVLLSIIIFINLIVLFFKVVERIFIKKQKQTKSHEAQTSANHAGVYIIESKFLC